jgi:hypothetical protein
MALKLFRRYIIFTAEVVGLIYFISQGQYACVAQWVCLPYAYTIPRGCWFNSCCEH